MVTKANSLIGRPLLGVVVTSFEGRKVHDLREAIGVDNGCGLHLHKDWSTMADAGEGN